MIARYARNGFVEKTLENFEQVKAIGMHKDKFHNLYQHPPYLYTKIECLEQSMDNHQSIKDIGKFSHAAILQLPL